MNYFLDVLKNKYADFKGRATRAEYWYFVLFYIILSLVAGFLDALINPDNFNAGMGIISTIYMFALLVPSIAVAVRRLHDTNKSGWWILIGFIPIIGTIWFIVLMVKDSTSGTNKYGPNPKEKKPTTPTPEPQA